MKKTDIEHQKHLDACRKYRENNRDKVRAAALAYAHRLKERDPEAYKAMRDERAKKYRLKSLEKHQAKEREASRRLRERDPEAYRAQQREYRKNNPEKFKAYYEKSKALGVIKARSRRQTLGKYGLTPEAYDSMVSEQEGKCAICEIVPDKKLAVDHDHITGRTRKLLCDKCNLLLGHVERSLERRPDIWERITEYRKTTKH